MKVFSNPIELLNRLHTERNLLNALFQARMKFDFSFDDALGLVSNEKNLHLLIDYGVVREESGYLELEETYQHFFEEILRLNDNVTSSVIEESLRLLNDNIDFYIKDRNSPESQRKYVNKIVRILRNIVTQAENKTVEMKRVIYDTYRQERNYEIKRKKLETNMSTLGNIQSLIKETENVLVEREDLLSAMTPDSRLMRISMDTRVRLRDISHSLIDLVKVTRDYLHQIDVISKNIKKIRKIKYLKDQLIWEKNTSVCSVLSQRDDMILQSNPYFSTKISLSFLRDTDEGLYAIESAQQAITNRKKRKEVAKITLHPTDLKDKFIIEDFVDTDVVAQSFFASSQDLYSFVIKKFQFHNNPSLDQKLEYYSEIIVNHCNRLIFTNDWDCDGSIKYPLIYAKR